VRRLIQIAIVALGVRAFLHWRKRRRAEAEGVTAEPPEADPADELRQKLAESRTEDATPAAPDANVEDRRADVHEQGRATLDDMKSSDES
jgi:hypothetical protein